MRCGMRCDARSVRVGLVLRSEVFRVSDLEYVSPGGFDAGAGLAGMRCGSSQLMMRNAVSRECTARGEQGQWSRPQSRRWMNKCR